MPRLIEGELLLDHGGRDGGIMGLTMSVLEMYCVFEWTVLRNLMKEKEMIAKMALGGRRRHGDAGALTCSMNDALILVFSLYISLSLVYSPFS